MLKPIIRRLVDGTHLLFTFILLVSAVYIALESAAKTAGTELFTAVIYIVFLNVIIFFAFIIRNFQTARKEKYANITERIHKSCHQARNILTWLNYFHEKVQADDRYDFSDNIVVVKNEMSSFLNHVQSVFEMLTGTRCRATIKVINKRNGKIYVDTLTRDSSSKQTWLELDNKRFTENIDLLKKNKCFSDLFSLNNFRWHFCCNDLTKEETNSTSKKAYCEFGTGENKKHCSPSKTCNCRPYRSALTCAIRQPQTENIKGVDVVGFLCIDSESRGVFDPRWDVQLGLAFADALFHPLNQLLILMNTSLEKRNEIQNETHQKR